MKTISPLQPTQLQRRPCIITTPGLEKANIEIDYIERLLSIFFLFYLIKIFLVVLEYFCLPTGEEVLGVTDIISLLKMIIYVIVGRSKRGWFIIEGLC